MYRYTCNDRMKYETWRRRKTAHMYITQAIEQMSFSGCSKTKSTCRKKSSVGGTKGADSNR
ncbi:hypothetical protein V1478_007568 [Vespula squamosa]|uniref:Uncharacterized protein n=1 Tax=Vespula squamosa TaxID=30214 RepID=A0ABD2B3L2_VESSQ